MKDIGSITLTGGETLSLLEMLERIEVEDGQRGFSRAEVKKVRESLSSGQIPEHFRWYELVGPRGEDVVRKASNANTIKAVSSSLSSRNLVQMITELRIALRYIDPATEPGKRDCIPVANEAALARMRKGMPSLLLPGKDFFIDRCRILREVEVCDRVEQGVRLLFKGGSKGLVPSAEVTEIVYEKSEIKISEGCKTLLF